MKRASVVRRFRCGSGDLGALAPGGGGGGGWCGWYGLFQACGLWVVAINRTIGKTANRVGCFVGKVSRHNGIR